MLMDQVFDAPNFLANLVWQGSVKSNARFSGAGVDYMVAFARKRQSLIELDTRWLEEKFGVHDVLGAGADSWRLDPDSERATGAFRAWWRKNASRLEPGLREYNRIDEQGRVFRRGDMGVNEARPNRSRHVLHHPLTCLLYTSDA